MRRDDTGQTTAVDTPEKFTERDIGVLSSAIGAAARAAVVYEESRTTADSAENRLSEASKDKEAADELLAHARMANDAAHDVVFEQFSQLLPAANMTSEGRIVLADQWLRLGSKRLPGTHSSEVFHSYKTSRKLDAFKELQEPTVSLVVDSGLEFGSTEILSGDIVETSGDLELYSDQKHKVTELAVLLPVKHRPEQANSGRFIVARRHRPKALKDKVVVRLDDLDERLIVGLPRIRHYFLEKFEPTEADEDKIRQSSTWATAVIENNVRHRNSMNRLGIEGQDAQHVFEEMHAANMRTAKRALGLSSDKESKLRISFISAKDYSAFVAALNEAQIFDDVKQKIAKIIHKNPTREAELVDFVARAVSDDPGNKPTSEAIKQTKLHLKELFEQHGTASQE